MFAGEASERIPVSIAFRPATPGQRRLALAVAGLQFIACGVVAPFAATPLARIDSFVPVILAVIFVADFITAVLLFTQSAVSASRAILVLANGYLFSALIVIPHALTFPGAIAPAGVLGGSIQSSGWLNVLWHFGFLVAVAVYSCLKGGADRDTAASSALSAFLWSLAIQLCLVCLLTWAVIAGDRFLPRMFLDDLRYAAAVYYAAGVLVLLAVVTLLMLWMRRTSVLDLWIMVAICMLISEMALVTFGLTARFFLGWYVSRSLAMAVSTIVLVALLSESMKLQTAQARANTALERERMNRLLTIQAVASSIVHEVRQPLTVVTSLVDAARIWLSRTPPDAVTATQLLDAIEGAAFRASDVLTSVRNLFRDADHEQQPIDVNDLARETLQMLSAELNDHDVSIDTQLTSGLPHIIGHKVQLQEVMLNLVNNAIDAMTAVKRDRRSLVVRTNWDSANAIAIDVEDSGRGIEPGDLRRVFEPFVTTKPSGTGLGLAICARIIERHGGQLTASSDGKSGALFHIVLPVAPASNDMALRQAQSSRRQGETAEQPAQIVRSIERPQSF